MKKIATELVTVTSLELTILRRTGAIIKMTLFFTASRFEGMIGVLLWSLWMILVIEIC